MNLHAALLVHALSLPLHNEYHRPCLACLFSANTIAVQSAGSRHIGHARRPNSNTWNRPIGPVPTMTASVSMGSMETGEGRNGGGWGIGRDALMPGCPCTDRVIDPFRGPCDHCTMCSGQFPGREAAPPLAVFAAHRGARRNCLLTC